MQTLHADIKHRSETQLTPFQLFLPWYLLWNQEADVSRIISPHNPRLPCHPHPLLGLMEKYLSTFTSPTKCRSHARRPNKKFKKDMNVDAALCDFYALSRQAAENLQEYGRDNPRSVNFLPAFCRGLILWNGLHGLPLVLEGEGFKN